MTPGVLRYGVVGAGRVFQQYHLKSLRERPEFTLAAVCDADADQARTMLGDLADGVLVTSDLDEFFASGRLNVVAVCTPNDAHTAPVLAAMKHGAAVLCEKPLAADLADARLMVQAARSAPMVGVNLPYRFHPLIPAFVAALPVGRCDITLRFATAGLRLWRPVTKWYAQAERAGGGALLDLGPHAIDLLTAVFGAPTVLSAVVDAAGVEERAALDLTFERGPARLLIDRVSRSIGLTVEARQGDAVVTLDVRRGEVRSGDDVVATTGDQVELAAISRFLDTVAGGPTAIVSADEALRLQEIIADAYAKSTIDPALRI